VAFVIVVAAAVGPSRCFVVARLLESRTAILSVQVCGSHINSGWRPKAAASHARVTPRTLDAALSALSTSPSSAGDPQCEALQQPLPVVIQLARCTLVEVRGNP